MGTESLFSDDASISVDGIWFVSRTTPIVYTQPNPDEVYLILGYNLGGVYPDRSGDELDSEAVETVAAVALTTGTPIRYVVEWSIRRESTAGAGDGTMRLQMGAASDMMESTASQPFTAAALGRGLVAIQALPYGTVYRLALSDLVDSGGDFDWLEPATLSIGADVWSVISTATEIRTVIYDPNAVTIDSADLLFDTAFGAPQTPLPVRTDLAEIFPGPPAPVAETTNVMWIDIVTAGVRSGPLRDILAWQQEEIWNEGSRFSFTAVEKEASARIESLSEVYAYSIVGGHVTLVGAGLVLTIAEATTQTETTLAVTGVGFEHELLTQPAVDLTFADTSHAAVVSALAALLPAGWSLTADPEIEENRLSLRIFGRSLLDAIRKCADIFGTRLDFAFGREIRMRTYYTDLQVAASNDGGLGARIATISRRTHATELVTILHPFAADKRARLRDVTETPPDGFELDADAGTITHAASFERYGPRHQEYVFRSLAPEDEDGLGRRRTANLLMDLSVNRLRQYGEPQITYQITLQAPRQMVRPFNLLPMRVRNPLVADSFRVASVSTTFDQVDELRQSMTLTSQQSVRLVDDVSLLARRLKDIADAVDLGLGAASIVYVGTATTAFTENGGGRARLCILSLTRGMV